MNWTSLTEARIVVVRSDRIETLIDGGIEACSCGSSALIRSTVSMTLAPGWRWIREDDRRARSLNHPASRLFSGPSIAWPISRMRTGAPLR